MEKKKFNETVGVRIRFLREDMHLTREELSEKADISTQFLADIETGRKSMTIYTFAKLSLALNAEPSYLLFGHEKASQFTEIQFLLNSLPTSEQILAEQLLRIFIKGVTNSKETEPKNKPIESQ